MIVFKNRGLIDMRAVTTFGVSAKGDNKSAIGYFGTGLKYAIAITLRHGGRISVWRGVDEYRFHAEKEEIRGDDFHFVYMEHYVEGVRQSRDRLGFTTHLGANWEPWQAFREVYCNCLDEAGETSRDGYPEVDYTTVIVRDFPAFEKAWADRNNIVLCDEPRYQNDRVEVRLRPSSDIYYRGVKVMQLGRAAMFTYNLVQPMHLTEDRTLKYSYAAEEAVVNSVLRSVDPVYITTLLRAPLDTWESHLTYTHSYLDEPSEVFLDTCAALAQDVSQPIAPSALTLLYRVRAFEHTLKAVELTSQEEQQLAFARRILAAMGYECNYPVTVVETLGKGVLGQAYTREGQIALARRAFEIGTKCVVGTLLEEFLHLAHQYQDESRDFQNFLLDKVVTLAIEQHAPGELV